MSEAAAKEPWNFNAFVSAYADVSEANGGYPLGNERTPEQLQKDYEVSIQKTIREFAYQIFLYLQRTD